MKPLFRLVATFAVVVIAGSLLSIASPANAARTAPQSATPASSAATLPTAEKLAAGKNLERRAARCYRKCFGAISMSPDQAWGGQYNTAKKKTAVRKAHNRCRANSNYPGRCRKMGWVRNGCMAVAIKTNRYGYVTKWSSGYGETLRGAKRQAKNRNHGGRIRAWVCTAN